MKVRTRMARTRALPAGFRAIALLGLATISLASCGGAATNGSGLTVRPLRLTGARRVTPAEPSQFLEWSPNSRLLLTQGSARYPRSLWLVSTRGGRRLLSRSASDAAFTTNGKAVVFLGCPRLRVQGKCRAPGLWADALVGGRPALHRLPFAGQVESAAAAVGLQDLVGKLGLAVRASGALAFIEPATGHIKAVPRVSLPPPRTAAFSVSPSGCCIAIDSTDGGLWLESARTGREIARLAPTRTSAGSAATVADMGWSNYGRILDYEASVQGKPPAYYSFNLGSRTSSLLFQGRYGISHFDFPEVGLSGGGPISWPSNGAFAAFSVCSSVADPCRSPLSYKPVGGPLQTFVDSTGHGPSPSWMSLISPSGRLVAYEAMSRSTDPVGSGSPMSAARRTDSNAGRPPDLSNLNSRSPQ